MKVLVTIKETRTATIDIGDLPIKMILSMLEANDGSFGGNWGIGDVAQADNEKYTTDAVTVEPLLGEGTK